MNFNTYDYIIKILLIGDSGVGKSCVLLRFADDAFTQSFITTIGIDFKVKTIEIDGKVIKLQIWDTAGQEKFKTVSMAYYRGAMGIMLVYDVTDDKSFYNIKNWITNIEQHASENVERMLIGNKCDRVDDKIIKYEQGKKIAEEYNMKFFETSAKNNINIEEAFITMAKDIKNKISTEPKDIQPSNSMTNIALSKDSTTTNKKCC